MQYNCREQELHKLLQRSLYGLSAVIAVSANVGDAGQHREGKAMSNPDRHVWYLLLSNQIPRNFYNFDSAVFRARLARGQVQRFRYG